ncbi:response regulator [Thalassococcus profundi]|nr:response regulator [Thalassococcus profundi]
MKILVVDDDPCILEMLPIILANEGMREVVCSASSHDALTAIEEASPRFDCFIFDIAMPGLTGIDLCRRVRATTAYNATPILMLTSLRDEESMRQALGAGATDYITKPFDILQIGVRIKLAHRLVTAREKITALTEGDHRDTGKQRLRENITRNEIMNLFSNELYKTGGK